MLPILVEMKIAPEYVEICECPQFSTFQFSSVLVRSLPDFLGSLLHPPAMQSRCLNQSPAKFEAMKIKIHDRIILVGSNFEHVWVTTQKWHSSVKLFLQLLLTAINEYWPRKWCELYCQHHFNTQRLLRKGKKWALFYEFMEVRSIKTF